MKPEATVEGVLAEIIGAGVAEDRKFVLLFCQRMFDAVFFERSNCKKASLFGVFQAAAEAVACKMDDVSAEMFCERIAQADLASGAYFKDVIADAFVRSRFSCWTELCKEIQKQEVEEAVLEMRRRLFPARPRLMDATTKHLMLKNCPTRRRRP
jgi:hypothetical protein